MAALGGTGRSGAALTALRRAQRASALARRLGCSVDEADGLGERQPTLSRRRFLAAAGAAAGAVVLPGAGAGTALAASRRRSETAGKVVIVGAGMAGLGCAYRLWVDHKIQADVYEYDTVAGGRIRTRRDWFADGQIVEEHAEFINPEHTATLALARHLGLGLDNTDRYPPGSHGRDETMRFHGQSYSQATLNEEWHAWGWALFHDAAFVKAPWPTLYDESTDWARRYDRMSVAEWIDTYIPGGLRSGFGSVCVAAVLDEYGGPIEEQSALNVVYLLGQDASRPDGVQPRAEPQLAGANEKWHIHGGNDQLVAGLVAGIPPGSINLGWRLAALRDVGTSSVLCSFERETVVEEVVADQVVLALPFTTLRLVDTTGVDISARHRQAIEQEPLGTNSKMFLQFDERVWNDEHRSGNVFCSGVVQGGWDPTLYQAGPAGILAALPGGEDGQRWGPRYGLTTYRGEPPPEMVGDFLAGWNVLFPGVKEAYNGRAYYVWSPGDPHILGAYSYLKTGQYTAFNGIQGQPEGNLHFAGEHTSVNFQGYIEGALRSGYRCAAEVARRS